MFKNRIFNSLALVLALILISFTVQAQPMGDEDAGPKPQDRRGHHGDHAMNCVPKEAKDELRNAIKEYKDINICPQFQEWKKKIDASISADDLGKLNDLRAKAAQLKAQHKADFDQLREKVRLGEITREDIKGMRGEMKSEMKDILEALKPIAQNNVDLIKSIGEEAKTKAESWKSDIHGIFEAWSEKYADDLADCPNFKDRKHFEMDGMKSKGKRFAMRLLLFNGDCSEMQDFGAGTVMDVPNNTSNGITVSNYPNPFAAATTIKFNLPQAGNVKLTVESGNGEVVTVLYSGTLSAGVHSFNFVPSANLAPGAYFYKLQGDGFKETGKMLLQK